MEQLSGSTLIFFAPLKMDIAHLVSHALAGLMQLSFHPRACDIKVTGTFYIGERLNGVNKKPISVKSCESSEPVAPLGAEPKPSSPKTASFGNIQASDVFSMGLGLK